MGLYYPTHWSRVLRSVCCESSYLAPHNFIAISDTRRDREGNGKQQLLEMSEDHGTCWLEVILCTTSSHRGICTCTCSVPTPAEHIGSGHKGTAQTVIETVIPPLTYFAAEHYSFNAVRQSSVSCVHTHMRTNHATAATHHWQAAIAIA